MIPGDVVFHLRQAPHPRFKREGDNLRYTQHLTLREALLGFHHEVKHLDGHVVSLDSDSVTAPFEVRRIKEEGMPVHNFPSQRGDLLVKVRLARASGRRRRGALPLGADPAPTVPVRCGLPAEGGRAAEGVVETGLRPLGWKSATLPPPSHPHPM